MPELGTLCAFAVRQLSIIVDCSIQTSGERQGHGQEFDLYRQYGYNVEKCLCRWQGHISSYGQSNH
jgi:hypothetical protein